jgi:hypothetical protein
VPGDIAIVRYASQGRLHSAHQPLEHVVWLEIWDPDFGGLSGSEGVEIGLCEATVGGRVPRKALVSPPHPEPNLESHRANGRLHRLHLHPRDALSVSNRGTFAFSVAIR